MPQPSPTHAMASIVPTRVDPGNDRGAEPSVSPRPLCQPDVAAAQPERPRKDLPENCSAVSPKPRGMSARRSRSCASKGNALIYPSDGLEILDWIGGRLPTAVEWEYAAKSGRDVIYPWGSDPVTAQRANYCDSKCPEALGKFFLEIYTGNHFIDVTQNDGWAAT